MSRLASPAPAGSFAERLEVLEERIEASGVDRAAIKLVAVTKGFGVEAAEASMAAGILDLGENYSSEMLAKAKVLSGRPPGTPTKDDDRVVGCAGRVDEWETRAGRTVPRWHFLGALHKRTIRALAPWVSCWQSVCRLSEGEEIARASPGARVFVQVDQTQIPGRNGCRLAETPELVDSLRELGLEVSGLMTLGPPGAHDEVRGVFRSVAAMAHELGLAEVSMGMSDDLEVALGEGATVLRIGRALFGDRKG